MSKIAALGTGIDEYNRICLLDARSVIMRCHHHIHTSKRFIQIKPLILQIFAVSLTGARMGCYYHHIRIILDMHPVYNFLSKRKQISELHSRP